MRLILIILIVFLSADSVLAADFQGSLNTRVRFAKPRDKEAYKKLKAASRAKKLERRNLRKQILELNRQMRINKIKKQSSQNLQTQRAGLQKQKAVVEDELNQIREEKDNFSYGGFGYPHFPNRSLSNFANVKRTRKKIRRSIRR